MDLHRDPSNAKRKRDLTGWTSETEKLSGSQLGLTTLELGMTTGVA